MGQDWLMRMLGMGQSAPAQRTTDIDLPYDGPWQNVPQAIRIAIQRAGEKHELPMDRLFRQVQTESQFDPQAGSPKGAQGLMQLMPLMQQHYGVEDPTDPMASMDAGAQYMKELIKKYGGDYGLALAAYNAGPTAVRKAGNKVPNYGETQRYVQKVLKGK